MLRGRKLEVQDIFKEYGAEHRRNHKLPLHQCKAMSAIENCRTTALGGHIDECDSCGHTRISYNSCRNRHCPKCQSLAKEKWLEERKKDLLPIGYFHIVFTIPSEFNAIALINPKEVYSLFFKSVSETLRELAKDHKYLGAEIGFTTILHTWGQNLMYHPHIHCIVPGGGLSLDNTRWIDSKKEFFIPIKVLSRKFRGKFLAYFKKAYYNNEFKLIKDIEELNQKHVFQCWINELYSKEWVVYSKAPFKSAEFVLEYLGRYTHRVAISNNRIVNVENGLVTVKWQDYKDNNKQKFMTLKVEEFIRRFLMHILPYNFMKIRHYGILSNRNRNTKLKKCKILLEIISERNTDFIKKLSVQELLMKLTGVDISKCPCCKKGQMIEKEKLDPKICSPPLKKNKKN